jgi:hypothetical protein
LFLAALFSIVCKDADNESDDADEDEEDPQLEWDDRFLDYDEEGKKKASISGSHKGPRIDRALIEEARRKRTLEIRVWSVIKELLFYSFYLIIIVVLSYGDQDPNSNFMCNNLREAFTRPGTGRIPFKQVTVVTICTCVWSDFWHV